MERTFDAAVSTITHFNGDPPGVLLQVKADDLPLFREIAETMSLDDVVKVTLVVR